MDTASLDVVVFFSVWWVVFWRLVFVATRPDALQAYYSKGQKGGAS